MKEITSITINAEYMINHFAEYTENPKSIKRIMQKYLDRAWELVEAHEASEYEALHIRDLGENCKPYFRFSNINSILR